MQTLGLDIGSSSIKGAVLDLQSGRIEQIVRQAFPEPIFGLPTGFHEVAPDQILVAAETVIDQLLHAAPSATALFTCSQMGGILLLDAEAARSGEIRPLTNYLSWRDQRTTMPGSLAAGSLAAGSLAAGSLEVTSLAQLRSCWTDDVFESLGKELKPGSATSLLHWLRLAGRMPRVDAMPVTVGDFVLSHLCHVQPRLERTQAIGLLDLRTGNWHHDAFAAAGLDDLCWPAITNEQCSIGIMTRHGRKILCYPAIGDQQAALRGVDLTLDELSVNVSTGSQVSQITTTFQPADCQTRCWFGGQYLNTITHIPAGRSLTALESLLTELSRLSGASIPDSWGLIAKEAEQSDAQGLRCDLSFFASAMGSEGKLEGMTTENLTVGNLFQAAFEFMADSYLTCSRRLSRQPTWKQLAVSGGLVQNFASLRRKLQARFPLPFREVAEQEETLLGLLKLARELLHTGQL